MAINRFNWCDMAAKTLSCPVLISTIASIPISLIRWHHWCWYSFVPQYMATTKPPPTMFVWLENLCDHSDVLPSIYCVATGTKKVEWCLPYDLSEVVVGYAGEYSRAVPCVVVTGERPSVLHAPQHGARILKQLQCTNRSRNLQNIHPQNEQ